jgi:RNA polymerase sigma-70 factor (ECF subfamily)
MSSVDGPLAARLHRRARAERWGLSIEAFAAALERGAAKLDAGDPGRLETALGALHLDDLALACACERGDEAAWEHFVLEYRPVLYRAASAIAGEDGRELADSLYAELFGLRERDGERQSLFRYFHGRSSLATWLRAVLAQRHIDGLRSRGRFDPLSEDDDAPATPAVAPSIADGEAREQAARVRAALETALVRLADRDRLRLAWYYQQGMTLAQIGQLYREHEATVSRHLSRCRKALRMDVEAQLRQAGLGAREIEECFAAAAADPGDADLGRLLGADKARKDAMIVRSRIEEQS